MKILITDYDDTLYTDHESMLINVKKIREFRAKGNLFVIATGRSYKEMEEVFAEYKIEFDYLILGHGAEIMDSNFNLIQKFPIDKAVVRNILAEIPKEAIQDTILYDTYNEYASPDSDDISKIMFIMESAKATYEAFSIINRLYGKHVKAYPIIGNDGWASLEIISIKTDKGQAIEHLLNYISHTDKEIFVIGNGNNDFEMIQKYQGYGMINSDESVLKVTNKLYNHVHELINEIIQSNN